MGQIEASTVKKAITFLENKMDELFLWLDTKKEGTYHSIDDWPFTFLANEDIQALEVILEIEGAEELLESITSIWQSAVQNMTDDGVYLLLISSDGGNSHRIVIEALPA